MGLYYQIHAHICGQPWANLHRAELSSIAVLMPEQAPSGPPLAPFSFYQNLIKMRVTIRINRRRPHCKWLLACKFNAASQQMSIAATTTCTRTGSCIWWQVSVAVAAPVGSSSMCYFIRRNAMKPQQSCQLLSWQKKSAF